MESYLSLPVIYRVAGAPVESIRNLRLNHFFDVVEKIEELKTNLEMQKDDLCEYLYDKIAQLTDDKVRQKLLRLKRHIYNLRRINNNEEFLELLELLSWERKKQIEEWKETIDQIKSLQEKLENTFYEELENKRILFKQYLSDNDFQSAVLLSSIQAYQGLIRYLEKEENGRKKGIPQTEISLFTYFSRMALKTSPFSSFTPLLYGTISKTGTHSLQDITLEMNELKKLSFLNHQFTSGIVQMLVQNSLIRPLLNIKVNPSADIKNNQIIYITPREITSQEQIIKIPVTPILEYILTHALNNITFKDLVMRISKEFEIVEEKVIQYLNKLIQIRFLEVGFPISERSPKYEEDIINFCNQTKIPSIINLANEFKVLLDNTKRYALLTEPIDRMKAIHTISNQVTKTMNALSGGNPFSIDTFGILYEDASIIQKNPIRVSDESLEKVKQPIDEVQYLGSLFNIHEPFRILGWHLLKEHFPNGQANDVLEFYSKFMKYIDENQLINKSSWWENWTQLLALPSVDLPELKKIKNVQQEIIQYIGKKIKTENKEVVLDSNDVMYFEELMRGTVEPPQSVSMFLQPTGKEIHEGLVINKMAQGFGMAFTRFEEIFDDFENGESLIKDLRINTTRFMNNHKVKLVDLGGVFRSNLNLHSGYLPYQLVTSYNLYVPKEQQVHLSDICIVNNEQEKRIVFIDKRDGKELRFVHTGLMSWFLLPPFYRFLIQMTTEAQPMMSFVERFEESLDLERKMEIRHYPRIALKQIVLERETWIIPIDKVPLRQKNELPYRYMIRLNEWRKNVGLPEACFYKIQPDEENQPNFEQEHSEMKLPELLTKWRKSQKPQYLDFKNPYSVLQCEKIISNGVSSLVITEMLPELNRSGRVTEMLVEWNYDKR
ncbi:MULTISPECIES: lantibiotic dehydratase [unclassified Bacillus (in: firmicutes)]|uniref:lantibiotic dehydratase n=1 Tax=unclassified Bacillus (in: firmicutes) TaxID=185979 RepID=UPI000BF374FB|nr:MULTISPECIES: lantibiotic dehydratase [unclassified Bacillus (in: firmicutes)]PEU19232.1 hypothetical protein CN525_08135 [Bacillus sp. AFS014408]PFW61615.1 hypothetical protein COL20_16710 [Bacillus sp. AFS075034]